MKKRRIAVYSCLVITFTLIFLNMVRNENRTTDTTSVRVDENTVTEHHYYMKNQNGTIIVFNKDHSVYEYTDLIPDFLPLEVKEQLLLGIHFQNQEELYEFLETYSS